MELPIDIKDADIISADSLGKKASEAWNLYKNNTVLGAIQIGEFLLQVKPLVPSKFEAWKKKWLPDMAESTGQQCQKLASNKHLILSQFEAGNITSIEDAREFLKTPRVISPPRKPNIKQANTNDKLHLNSYENNDEVEETSGNSGEVTGAPVQPEVSECLRRRHLPEVDLPKGNKPQAEIKPADVTNLTAPKTWDECSKCQWLAGKNRKIDDLNEMIDDLKIERLNLQAKADLLDAVKRGAEDEGIWHEIEALAKK